MARFYGGVEGQRGPATRQGSADSGMRVYAQSYNSRITVDYNELRFDNSTRAHITLGGGWTTYYREFSIAFNPDEVAAALDTHDERMLALWKQVQDAFAKMADEAPRALQRARGEWQIKGHIRRLSDGRVIRVKPHVRKIAA